ncbi:hypothetical protein C5167_032340 [Papaver somniferum]|uniref:RRM domain-containing protein n=1 Tax=Papaver somniferum TaxID=3469 RepID=A0A4Y7KBB9_PAPSO|nr:heterogeneous nuclear ribonucleoprotein Q-like [Papaver somniferum]XP_026401514.1 heterogeneous nuclear ribonucleoprotein Q-like [Papaver somniferum]XP_026401516.1 heterogeneous nuclear ribonucleoprotein Q-like [Papaver somniferum]XP_026401517.1 heterogeneous nuclear ribonucleoprotein Q-like [Papaver somniferum]RZC69265.1 hypothetical protein C5167_032340 [Papaver somniferum]
MPPRAMKKTAGPKKTTGRPARGAAAKQKVNKEESVKIEEVKEEEMKVIETVQFEEPVPEPEPEPELKREANGSSDIKEEDDVKETFYEEDRGERLELEDNDAEYEPEEDVPLDYDEKEIEHEDDPEEGDGVEEEPEEGDLGEHEEGDMVVDEMEEVAEEVEGEEGEENIEEGHHHMAEGEDEEHHEVARERRKRKEFEIFVGGLDKDATDEDLKKVFNAVGEVIEVRLMMNPQTKKNKGFAFLRFATVEQAKRAVTEMKSPVVNGKQCGVTPCQDSDTLFLGNVCKTWTKEALKEKLKYYGIDSIDDLTLVEDKREGRNRGFAFLDFVSHSEAVEAYKRLLKKKAVFGVDRIAKVAFADSFIQPDDAIMAQVKTVFVDGLPASWNEDRVKEHLKKFGEIEKIELARNMPSAKRKDFGFISFCAHDEAVACAEGINNSELGEGENKVMVRARLSRPHQRGRGKHPHGDFQPGRGIPYPSRGGSWIRPGRSLQGGIGDRMPPPRSRGFKSPIRGRRPVMDMPERVRPLPPPVRSYTRRPIPSYTKSSSKRDYGRRDELPPRSRIIDYSSRAPVERRSFYRDDYSPPRGSGYADEIPPRIAARTAARRGYIDESYERRFERPPPSYRDARSRDYESVSGSKRQYSALEDVPPRYADAGPRQRARLDYGEGGSASHYGEAYNDRLGRSHLGYGASRSSLSAQDSHGIYGSRQSLGYSGGSYGGNDVSGMYTSYAGDYISRGPYVGSSSYSSSLYSSRSLGGSSYLGGGGSSSGSGSYY